MNKHRLGVSHRRGGLFYRLYFITVCHLHRGMLIASCDYLHIWKSTSICHVPPISHESVPPSPGRTTAVYSQGDRQHQSLATPCTLHPAVWHMWTSHERTTCTREASHISPCHVAPSLSPRLSSLQRGKYALAPSTAVRASRLCVGGFINGGTCVNWGRTYHFQSVKKGLWG